MSYEVWQNYNSSHNSISSMIAQRLMCWKYPSFGSLSWNILQPHDWPRASEAKLRDMGKINQYVNHYNTKQSAKYKYNPLGVPQGLFRNQFSQLNSEKNPTSFAVGIKAIYQGDCEYITITPWIEDIYLIHKHLLEIVISTLLISDSNLLDTLRPSGIGCLLQTTFPHSISSIKNTVFWFTFHWNIFPWVQLLLKL